MCGVLSDLKKRLTLSKKGGVGEYLIKVQRKNCTSIALRIISSLKWPQLVIYNSSKTFFLF